MKKLVALAATCALVGCATYQTGPTVDDGRAAPAGTAVGLGQPVRAGSLVITPKAVSEDSRCPENARCVWAGRLIVSTRIDGTGWRETAPLTLGVPHATHGTTITLVSGLPEKQAGQENAPEAYRFTFEGGS